MGDGRIDWRESSDYQRSARGHWMGGGVEYIQRWMQGISELRLLDNISHPALWMITWPYIYSSLWQYSWLMNNKNICKTFNL